MIHEVIVLQILTLDIVDLGLTGEIHGASNRACMRFLPRLRT